MSWVVTGDSAGLLSTVSAYIATLGVFFANGATRLEAIVGALPIAALIFFLSQTLVPWLDENRVRRRRHKESIVQNSVKPALAQLRPQVSNNVLEHVRTARHRSDLPPTLSPTTGWAWLLEHDGRVRDAASAVEECEKQFTEAYARASSRVLEPVRTAGWTSSESGAELSPGEIHAPRLANAIIDAALSAKAQPFRPPSDGTRAGDFDWVIDGSVVARASDTRLLDLHRTVGSAMAHAQESVVPLRPSFAKLSAARHDLQYVLETLDAEGLVAGRCSACPRIIRS